MSNFPLKHLRVRAVLKHAAIGVCMVLLALLSAPLAAYYSEEYNAALSDLVIVDPDQAIEIATANLVQARRDNSVVDQLTALYYIATAQLIISETDAIDLIIAEGLALAEEHDNLVFQTEFIGLLASRLDFQGRFLEALDQANRAIGLARQIGDNRLIALQLAIRGAIHLTIGNNQLALSDLEESTRIFRDNNDSYNLGLNYNLLAILHHDASDYETAIEYYKESASYDLEESAYNQSALAYNLATAYFSLGDYEQAERSYRQSAELARAVDDMHTTSAAQIGIAELQLTQDAIDEAEETLQPLFQIVLDADDPLMLFNLSLLMARVKIKQAAYADAQIYIRQAERAASVTGLPRLRLKTLQRSAELYAAQEQWQAAFAAQQAYSELNEALRERREEELNAELRVRYSAQLNQEKVALLEEQNQLQQAVITQQDVTKRYLWLLLAGGFIALMLTFIGYRRQQRLKAELYQLSTTDSLTQVANRRHIIDQLKQMHQKSLTGAQPFTLVMVDLDHFKSINDSYGHDTGNEVLIAFAQTVQTLIADTGSIGRVGGEEWLILLKTDNEKLVRAQLDLFRKRFSAKRPAKIPHDYTLSFSSGILICTGQYNSYEHILSDADAALYQAKQAGRNQDVLVGAEQKRS